MYFTKFKWEKEGHTTMCPKQESLASAYYVTPSLIVRSPGHRRCIYQQQQSRCRAATRWENTNEMLHCTPCQEKLFPFKVLLSWKVTRLGFDCQIYAIDQEVPTKCRYLISIVVAVEAELFGQNTPVINCAKCCPSQPLSTHRGLLSLYKPNNKPVIKM